MIPPSLPSDEQERLSELRSLGLLDTPPSERFDRVTRLAALILEVPVALVTLIDEQRQWFLSRVGLDIQETPRDVSFCGHAILRPELFEIPDAALDPRFADNPLVKQPPSIRFYAGRPLNAPGGRRVGTLCVIDRKPRCLSDGQKRALEDLAGIVEDELASAHLARQVRGFLMADPASAPPAPGEVRLTQVLASAVKTSIIATDSVGRIVLFSPGAERLLGWSAKDMHGHTAVRLFPPEELAARLAARKAPVERGMSDHGLLVDPTLSAGFEARECECVRRDGTRVPVDLVVTPMRGPDGVVSGYLGIAEDASARKQSERLRAQIIHHVNHELRTPASVQTMALEIMAEELKGKLNPDEESHLRIALNASKHLVRMVADLLDVAGSESGKLTVEMSESDLSEGAGEVVALFAPLAAERGLSLTLQGADRPRTVWADATRSRQVLSNLLDNALKFTPRGGRVAVTLTDDAAGFLRVEVRDDGPGMSPEDAARVFDRLYQTANKVRAGQPGLGLGLFIARELVERQGGRIGLETAKGGGCRFWFTLLAARAAGA